MTEEEIDRALKWLKGLINERKDNRSENPYPHIDDDNWIDDEFFTKVKTALHMTKDGVLYNISDKDDMNATRDDWRTLPELITIAKKQRFDPTHRHRKRDTVYQLLGSVTMQCESALFDDKRLTLYRGEDGQYWCRPPSEFNDGRFESLVQGEFDLTQYCSVCGLPMDIEEDMSSTNCGGDCLRCVNTFER